MLGVASPADRLSVDIQNMQGLRTKAQANDPEALRSAAKQFEAMVVQMMMKTMRATQFTQEGDVFGDSSTLKMYNEMLDQQWAAKLVEAKGFGFADAMVKAMEARNKALSPEATAAMGQLLPKGAADASPNPPAPAAQDSLQKAQISGPSASADNAKPNDTGNPIQQFIERLRPHAEAAAKKLGVPTEFVLGHAALETGWGQHTINDAAGNNSHNLFGIKAGRSWEGASAETTTTEYRGGLPMKLAQNFRAYADYSAAFDDYASLLQRRYQDVTAAGNDPAAFAKALANGGYATDPAYASKLTGTINAVLRHTS